MLFRRGNDETLEERHWKEGVCNSVVKWKVPRRFSTMVAPSSDTSLSRRSCQIWFLSLVSAMTIAEKKQSSNLHITYLILDSLDMIKIQ